jgi:cation:H+ antiporter
VNPTFQFVLSAVITLAASALLVTRLERVGARLGFTEALLGLTTALAANAPEITSAVTALARGQREIGIGVVLGSNVFNLAALLGLGALVAGRINLHRRVIALVGGVSVWIAAVSLGTITTSLPVVASLILVLAVFIPYVIVSAWPDLASHLGLSELAAKWIRAAIQDEEAELADAIHPEPGDWHDTLLAGVALVIVVLASIVMEHAASSMGSSLGWSSIAIGAVVLAGVTSLPNAVAAVYFAAKGRGSVVLSEALNSNNLNALVGFMVPAAFIGLGHPSGTSLVVAGFYAGLTVAALAIAYVNKGLTRLTGSMIIAAYVAFVVIVAVG